MGATWYDALGAGLFLAGLYCVAIAGVHWCEVRRLQRDDRPGGDDA